MAQAVFGSPIKKLYGETASLTTTAYHLGVRPGYHEVMFYCASAWRLGLAPKLTVIKYATNYTNYTAYATDRNTATHVPLDGMTTAQMLYLGTTEPTRGFYFIIDGTNKNAVAATLDFEYCYDISDITSTSPFLELTGTVSGALTVGETVTGQTSGTTATLVSSGATSIVVKDVSGQGFKIGEDVDGAAHTCDDLTAITPVARGTGYFTDVAGDSDGTASGGATLAQTGLYSFTLPSVKRGALAGICSEPLFWYRFKPSTTLSATIDIQEIYAATDTVNYAYMEAGTVYQFSLNQVEVGAFEFDHTGSATLDITWIMH